MKIYKLDVNTAQPTRQVVAMQQNSTGLLSVDVKRNDWPIRNLSCALYDGDTEISSCLSGESGAGFKLDVGADAKVVKLVAQSTPIECSTQYIASYPSGNRTRTVTLKICNIPAGEYKQEEFYNLVENLHTISSDAGVVTEYYGLPCMVNGNQLSNTNFNRFYVQSDKFPPVQFQSYYGGTQLKVMPQDEKIITTAATLSIYTSRTIRTTTAGPTISSFTYPAIGYYTDYQLDTTIRPSDNAPYDRKYKEPIKEIEVDGVKFIPTTLSVDGVEYKVLAEAQPAPEPEPTPDPEEPVEP